MKYFAEEEKPEAIRIWELVGWSYYSQNRFHEAMPIYLSLYEHMIKTQQASGKRLHKGNPLVWLSDCFLRMNFPVHSKRYLMLTFCEDAVTQKGKIDPNTSGVYFRLAWQFGMADGELKRYAEAIFKVSQENPQESFYPEWILQELDKNWMTEFPTAQEGSSYKANRHYIEFLLSSLGEGTGKNLERLADYVLSCMAGCKAYTRQRTESTDYDIVCSMEGFEVDFRSEFGRYFVCEAKDWDKPADFTTMAKLCRVLDSVKSRFGILFSSRGLSGEGKTKNAEREQLKVFQDRGMVIVVIDEKDFRLVANGSNFISLLRGKYERVRLDLLNALG